MARGRPRHRLLDFPAMRSLRAAAAAFILLLGIPSVALADAELVSTIPVDGVVLTIAPSEVVLTFDEPLTDRSSFAVLDASGATVAEGALDPTDSMTIRGALPDLAPGVYEVQWVAQSSDGHLPRGTFTFTVLEPTPAPPTPTPAPSEEPTASPAASPTPTPTGAPSPAPSAAGGGGDSSSDVIIPIAVVGLLIGGGLAFFLRRRGGA